MRAKMAAGGDTAPSFTTDELLRHYASIEAQGESVLLDRQQVCNKLDFVYPVRLMVTPMSPEITVGMSQALDNL